MTCRAKLPIRWMEAPLEGEPVEWRKPGDWRTGASMPPLQGWLGRQTCSTNPDGCRRLYRGRGAGFAGWSCTPCQAFSSRPAPGGPDEVRAGIDCRRRIKAPGSPEVHSPPFPPQSLGEHRSCAILRGLVGIWVQDIEPQSGHTTLAPWQRTLMCNISVPWASSVCIFCGLIECPHQPRKLRPLRRPYSAPHTQAMLGHGET